MCRRDDLRLQAAFACVGETTFFSFDDLVNISRRGNTPIVSATDGDNTLFLVFFHFHDRFFFKRHIDDGDVDQLQQRTADIGDAISKELK